MSLQLDTSDLRERMSADMIHTNANRRQINFKKKDNSSVQSHHHVGVEDIQSFNVSKQLNYDESIQYTLSSSQRDINVDESKIPENMNLSQKHSQGKSKPYSIEGNRMSISVSKDIGESISPVKTGGTSINQRQDASSIRMFNGLQISSTPQSRLLHSRRSESNRLYVNDEKNMKSTKKGRETVLTSIQFGVNNGLQKATEEKKKWSLFAKMLRVRKFCSILSEQIFYKNCKNLTKVNLTAIGDASNFEPSPKQLALFDTICRIKLIEPNSPIDIMWNTIFCLTLFQQYIIIPIEICFKTNLSDANNNLYIFNFLVPSIVFLFDILLRFNTAYYRKGSIITDRQTIWTHYIKSSLWIDVLTTCSFLLRFRVNYLSLGILPRVLYLPQFFGKISDHFQLQQRFNTFIELFKLLLLIFACAHLVACGFHLIALVAETAGSVTWLEKQNLIGEDLRTKYMQSFYFAIITMVTVGYGDISPISSYERIYVVIITIFSSGLFGYSINTIGLIFQEIAKRDAAFQQAKYEISQYMRIREIPKALQAKVLKQLEYNNKVKQKQAPSGEIIMNTLTVTLRNQIKREFYGRILSTYKLFNYNFSKEARQEISLIMKELILLPGENLFEAGMPNNSIYFLYSGQIKLQQQVHNNTQPTTIGIAKAGSMLGQRSFFTNQFESVTTKSIDTCLLLSCDRTLFLQAISKFTGDQEMFCKLRDNILVYNRQPDAVCFSCMRMGHEASKCQIYTTKLLPYIVIGKHQRSVEQTRDSHPAKPRRSTRHMNSLLDRKHAMMQARRIRLSYFFEAFNQDKSKVEDEELELELEDTEFVLFIPKIFYNSGNISCSEGEIAHFTNLFNYYASDQLNNNYAQDNDVASKGFSDEQQTPLVYRNRMKKLSMKVNPQQRQPQLLSSGLHRSSNLQQSLLGNSNINMEQILQQSETSISYKTSQQQQQQQQQSQQLSLLRTQRCIPFDRVSMKKFSTTRIKSSYDYLIQIYKQQSSSKGQAVSSQSEIGSQSMQNVNNFEFNNSYQTLDPQLTGKNRSKEREPNSNDFSGSGGSHTKNSQKWKSRHDNINVNSIILDQNLVFRSEQVISGTPQGSLVPRFVEESKQSMESIVITKESIKKKAEKETETRQSNLRTLDRLMSNKRQSEVDIVSPHANKSINNFSEGAEVINKLTGKGKKGDEGGGSCIGERGGAPVSQVAQTEENLDPLLKQILQFDQEEFADEERQAKESSETFYCLEEFDQQREYKSYFPNNNLSMVLNSIRNRNLKLFNMRLKRKNRMSKGKIPQIKEVKSNVIQGSSNQMV